MFKPNIAPLLLDQNPHNTPMIKVLKSGERVIIDPEATTERTMTWFYLMINIGGMMAVATAYSEKYVGWWLAFVLPLFLYLPLPLLMVRPFFIYVCPMSKFVQFADLFIVA